MNEKPNTCLKKFGLQVSISYFFHSPDTLVAAQARNLVHEKKKRVGKKKYTDVFKSGSNIPELFYIIPSSLDNLNFFQGKDLPPRKA